MGSPEGGGDLPTRRRGGGVKPPFLETEIKIEGKLNAIFGFGGGQKSDIRPNCLKILEFTLTIKPQKAHFWREKIAHIFVTKTPKHQKIVQYDQK